MQGGGAKRGSLIAPTDNLGRSIGGRVWRGGKAMPAFDHQTLHSSKALPGPGSGSGPGFRLWIPAQRRCRDDVMPE
ncbi:MAG: hypothetical protein ABSG91_04885 [Syntrophobacteraceae bacterium]